jgi:general secretion pathway protein A
MSRYVHHRLVVAGARAADLFSPAALRVIHRFSGGIPRLINMACDRALLTAFGVDRPRVTWLTARAALRELRGKTGARRVVRKWSGRLTLALMTAMLLAGLVAGAYLGGFQSIDGGLPGSSPHLPEARRFALPAPDSPPAAAVPEAPPPAAVPDPPLTVDRPALASLLKASDPARNRRDALAATLESWGGPIEIQGVFEIAAKDAGFFRMAAVRNGFSLQQLQGALTDIQHFGLPVILAMRLPQRQGVVYLSMTAIDAEIVSCRQSPDRPAFHARWRDLTPFYTGVFYLVWKNPRGYSGVVSASSSREKILKLEEHLLTLGVTDGAPAGVYEGKLAAAIRVLQRRHGLTPDGLAGPMTQLALYRETPGYQVPALNRSLTRREAIGTAEGGEPQ